MRFSLKQMKWVCQSKLFSLDLLYFLHFVCEILRNFVIFLSNFYFYWIWSSFCCQLNKLLESWSFTSHIQEQINSVHQLKIFSSQLRERKTKKTTSIFRLNEKKTNKIVHNLRSHFHTIYQNINKHFELISLWKRNDFFLF